MSDFWAGKTVKARKQYVCIYCGEKILAKEVHYHGVGIWMGDWQNWRMHQECSEAHQAETGDGEIYEYESERPNKLNDNSKR